MKKRIFYATAAILFLFGLGTGLDFGITKEDHLATYVGRIERSLHKKESEVQTFFQDTGFIHRQLRGIEKLPSLQQEADLKHLLELAGKQFNIRLYQHDSMVYWLNNRAFLSPEQVEQIRDNPEAVRLVRLSNGYFELIKKQLSPDVLALAMIPIKKEYARQSEFLPNTFVTDDFPIPDDVFLKEQCTDRFVIHTMGGQALACLDATGQAKDRLYLQLVFLVYVLGFIAVGVLINDVAVLLVRKYQPWVGAAFILGAIVCIRWLIIRSGFTHHFSIFQTFSNVFTTPIVEGVNSLGELLINIILLVWMMVFFNREFQVKEFVHPSLAVRFGLTSLNFFSVNLGMLMVCSIFKSIVLDSSIVFDFENVFNLNSQSVLAMTGVVLLLLAFFLFSHRMMLAIHKIGLDKYWRTAALGISLVCTIPILMQGRLQLPLPYFLAAAAIFAIVFELFLEVRVLTLQWLVSWLMLFSAFTALLLYKYNSDKDYLRRTEYATALSSFQDEQAEQIVSGIGQHLLNDSTRVMWNMLTDYFEGAIIPREEARDIIEAQVGINKYLLHNYDFQFSGFLLESGAPAFTDQRETLGEMEEQFHQAAGTGWAGLHFRQEKTRDPGYLMRLELRTDIPLTLFIKFKRSFSSPSKVYTELLLDKKYKNLTELDNYDYGIYQDGKLLEERNRSFGKQLTDTLPPPGQTIVVKQTSTRSELLYHAPDNNIAIKIGRQTGGYIKPLSLFSYVFTMLAFAVLIFGGINYYTNALPGPLNFFKAAKPSLRNQFQFWIISMILVSFLGIGFVTVWYFQQSSNGYHKGRLDRKVTSALANVNYEIKAWHKERQREWEKERREASERQGGRLRTKSREERAREQAGAAQQHVRENGEQEREEREREEAMETGGVHKMKIELDGGHSEYKIQDTEEIDAFSLASLIPLISEVHRLDVNIYDLEGNLITSSEEDIFRGGLVSPKMGAYAYQSLIRLGYERRDQDESIGNLDYTAAYLPLKNLEGETLAFMSIPYYARHRELRSEVTDFMSTLLNVYVFLLLIAGGLAIVIAGRVTKALAELGENLQQLRLGGNEPITVWKRRDEIGDLVNAYNQALHKLDDSSRLLAQSEREGAWREMAKQVAHEIKNPLTPMKLSVQYLVHAYQADSDPKLIGPLLKRVSNTLVEQIESLAQIANEFSNFASMPKPENMHFSINTLAYSVHHLFKNERPDMDITIELPPLDYEVFADRSHVTRVLNNLLKNAIQAIPDARKGIIQVALYAENDYLIVRVKDNGSGIPPDIQEKVFSPNFSTKNSGTGLGLAISKSIIESFSGDIYFETVVGVGTTFYIKLPLVKSDIEELAAQPH